MNKMDQTKNKLSLTIYPTEPSLQINSIVNDLNNELNELRIEEAKKKNNKNATGGATSGFQKNQTNQTNKFRPKQMQIIKKKKTQINNDFTLIEDTSKSHIDDKKKRIKTKNMENKSKSDSNLIVQFKSYKDNNFRHYGKTKDNDFFDAQSQADVTKLKKNESTEICFPNLIEPSPFFGKNYAKIIMKIYQNQFDVNTVKDNMKKLAPLFKIVPPYSKHFPRFLTYKQRVEQAIEQRKVFVMNGDYQGVKDALLDRGWIEMSSEHKNLLQHTFYSLLKNARTGNKYETALYTKLLKNSPANFVWQTREMEDMHADAKPYRNMIRCEEEYDFTNKEGLLNCVNNAHWYTINGVSEIQTPRTYNLNSSDGRSEFRRNYRTTYCISLLYFIIEKSEKFIKYYNSGQFELDKNKTDYEQKFEPGWFCTKNEMNSIPLHALRYAFDRIEKEIKYKRHDDIDIIINMDGPANEDDWEKFKSYANLIQLQHKKLHSKNIQKFGSFLQKCEQYLYKSGEIWPIQVDGYMNIWIVKPSKLRRGEGIIVTSNYKEIMNLALKDPNVPYIVQKYIERPLLIHNTKFDIRQYMLTTVRNNILTIWMYKESYIRFSSQEFNLNNLHESVHLTNYIIQRKYKNGARSPHLPYENMWYLYQFKNYLNSINRNGIYKTRIYPKMKKHFIAIVLASLEHTNFIDKSFEIYGCDFMLDSFFHPYLIEVNHTPGMSYFTDVMTKCCSKTLKDLVKVVVDYSHNSKADTGLFEKIYQISLNDYRLPNKRNKLQINGDKLKIYKVLKKQTVTISETTV